MVTEVKVSDNRYYSYGTNLRSPVKMDKGSKKRSIFEEIRGANDKRFEPVYINPKILAKYVNHDAPDFKRYTRRESQVDEDSLTRKRPPQEKHPMPDYNPDKEKYLRSLKLGQALFEKQISRNHHQAHNTLFEG